MGGGVSGSSYDIKINEHGFYEIHWLDGRRTKRKSLRTKDPKLAYARASHYLEEAEFERQNLHDPNIEYLIDYYMKHRAPEVVDGTRLVYCNRHLLEHFKNTKPRAITPPMVRGYIEKRRSGRLGRIGADGTIRKELGHLVAVINYCAKAGLIKRESIPFIELPHGAPPKDRWLTLDEIARVTELAKGRGNVELFFHIALRTAARKTSIMELRWDQIDFEKRLIYFGKHDAKVRRAKRRATVPISDKLMPYLVEAKSRAINEFVFAHPEISARTAFENLMDEAGLSDVTPHTLRHTWATHASMSGVPMNEIARVLGDTIQTVERVYAKFAPEYLKDAVNAVNF